MVYPGPRGPIPTRASKAIREGWEDYCLLTLLREQGDREALDRILEAYAAGALLESLRAQALRAAGGG